MLVVGIGSGGFSGRSEFTKESVIRTSVHIAFTSCP